MTSGEAGLEPFVDRVTMTLPAVLAAGRMVVLVDGPDKAWAVGQAFGDEIGEDVPARLLLTGTAPLDVYLDEAAASRALRGSTTDGGSDVSIPRLRASAWSTSAVSATGTSSR